MEHTTDDYFVPDINLAQFQINRMRNYGTITALEDAKSGRSYTYNDVIDRIQRMAAGLRDIGLQKDDVICMMSLNSVEHPIIWYAANMVGATFQPVSPEYTDDDLVRRFTQCSPTILVTTLDQTKRAKQLVYKANLKTGSVPKQNILSTLVVLGDSANVDGFISYDTLFSRGRITTETKVDGTKSVSLILTSSGTTGLPKAVLLTHRNMLANLPQMQYVKAMNWLRNEASATSNFTRYLILKPGRRHITAAHRFWSFSFVYRNNECYQHSPGQLSLVCLAMFHHYGLVSVISEGLYNGTTMVVMEKYQFYEYLDLIKRYKPEILQLVPPIAFRLVKYTDKSQYDMSSVKFVQNGAAPLGPGIEEELRDLFNVKYIAQERKGPEAELKKMFNLEYVALAYGLTEAGFMTGNKPNLRRAGSNGLPPKGVHLKIADPETGNPVSANQTGEICVKGHMVSVGYLNEPEISKRSFDLEDYFKTGDLGYRDDDGFLFIVGRQKELIKYKAFQVAPAYLEDMLTKHPDVADSAVIGIPDVEAGELPKAFIVRQPNSNVTEEEICKYIRDKVDAHNRLRGGVTFISQIPRSASGKILRHQLKTPTYSV